MADTEKLLQEGIAAAKAGKRDAARTALMQVVEVDERNERAWLWLAGVVDDPADQRVCLENVLDLNPENTQAKKGLAWLNEKYPAPAEEPPAPPEVPAATQPTVVLDKAPAATQPTIVLDKEAPAPAETGPTRQLSYDGKTPVVTRPKDPVPEQPPPAPPAPPEPPPSPCPYCGAPTSLQQGRCPKCHRDLTARGDVPERRSIATTILAILWMLSGIPTVLGGILYIGAAIYLSLAIRSDTASETFMTDPEMAEVFALLDLGATVGVVLGGIILVFGVLYIMIGRGFLKRRPWAYVTHCVLLVLNSLVAVPLLLFSLVVPAVFSGMSAQSGETELAGAFLGQMVATLVCGVVPLVLYVVLTFKSYRDFYGPKVRLVPEVEANDDVDLYNVGVAFKDRGMWYMAAKAWEGAAKLRPRDANYRHALGLAYAQLKQFDRAIPTLQEAVAIAPDDTRIQESLALVEKQAIRK